MKYVEALYSEGTNYCWQKVRDLNTWRDIPCSWIGRPNIIMMAILPKLVYSFSVILNKILVIYFVQIGKKTNIYKEKILEWTNIL